MTIISRLAGLAMALALLIGAPVSAQTPPAANDALLLQYLKQAPGDVTGRITIPDQKAGWLIQPEGRDWRASQSQIATFGAVVILGFLALVGGFYMIRGKIKIDKGPSGKTITRFQGVERFAHWLTASSFIVLAISGLNLIYGKSLLLPVIGPEAFTTFSIYGKLFHNFLSFPFCLGLVLMLVMWISHNLPNAVDVEWFKQGGGLLKKGMHPPAGKFNGGQKIIFWSTILIGAGIAVTGYILMFPFTAVPDMAGMQLAQVLHSVLSLGLIGVIIGHIYIGSVGMEGAFDAMGKGEVDLNWAKEHHSLWVKEQEAKARSGAD
ncbi:MAG: formate dehydrogenase subunit gamma [Elsteraceae bacterium]